MKGGWLYSMSVYEGYKVYGPYTRKDGRQHVILVECNKCSKGTRITVSYPKYLVETYLDRLLEPDETVDHIDGNFSNNSLDNLRVVPRNIHCKSHAKHKKVIQKMCVICGSVFSTNNNNRVVCGNKQCSGKCTRNRLTDAEAQQLESRIKNSRKVNKYIIPRSLIQEIESVEGANSVNPLIGNTEQDT